MWISKCGIVFGFERRVLASLQFVLVWLGISQLGWVRLNAFTNGQFIARLEALDAE